MRRLIAAAVMLAVLAGCASTPRQTHDACAIFKQKSGWYQHTRRAAKKWNTDAPVMLAIMKQESSFVADARPRRKRFLGIPLRRPSSAYGYAQAINSTWRYYKRDAGRFLARRNRFKDAMDFIGWYVAQTRKRLGVGARDARRNYLAYHEGWSGYANGAYKRKKWLLGVAKKVANQAGRYRAQLQRCGYEV